MNDTKGEGCGIYPLLLKRSKFIAACTWHDKAYSDQSWAQLNLTRKEVDDWFLGQMLEIAGNSKLRMIQAYVFHGIARTLGWIWWEGRR
jgi:hypothetical protein